MFFKIFNPILKLLLLTYDAVFLMLVEKETLMKTIAASLLLVTLLSGCSTLGEYNLNPLDWFASEEAAN